MSTSGQVDPAMQSESRPREDGNPQRALEMRDCSTTLPIDSREQVVQAVRNESGMVFHDEPGVACEGVGQQPCRHYDARHGCQFGGVDSGRRVAGSTAALHRRESRPRDVVCQGKYAACEVRQAGGHVPVLARCDRRGREDRRAPPAIPTLAAKPH